MLSRAYKVDSDVKEAAVSLSHVRLKRARYCGIAFSWFLRMHDELHGYATEAISGPEYTSW